MGSQRWALSGGEVVDYRGESGDWQAIGKSAGEEWFMPGEAANFRNG